MAFRRARNPEGRMSLADHLRELRRRFLISAVAVLIGAVIGWVTYPRVYGALAAPFNDYKTSHPHSVISLNFGNATAAFSQQVSISIFVGVLVSSPVWMFQLWAFIVPGLTRKERRISLAFIAAIVPLFLAGCGLAYVVLPKVLAVLYGFTPPGASNIQQVADYFSFVTRFILAFGCSFLGILDSVREQIPDAAITTDIIVGFPGETEQDFEETLRVVREARFASAFTFQYSIRPGTPAATMPGQLPKAVVQERYERLIEAQEQVSWAENRLIEGREVEVLVATGEGRKDSATQRLSGRARDNRLVHFTVPEGGERPRPGDLVTVGVTYGAPHHLVADAALDGGPYAVRRTPGGDAWAALQDAPVPGKPAVSLGMPSVGRPATSPVSACR
jgi:Tat protein translocase TatC